MDFLGRRERDYRATRLLDFIDSPNLRGKGSMEFQLRLARFYDGSYNNVDQYRYTIRHLVFMVGYEGMPFCSLAFQYNVNNLLPFSDILRYILLAGSTFQLSARPQPTLAPKIICC
jgi:hypothetical protein